MSTPLLIGSCEPFSGKSAVVLGLGRQLARQGVPSRLRQAAGHLHGRPARHRARRRTRQSL